MPSTRRRFLRTGAAAVLGGLAGCSDTTSDVDDAPSRRSLGETRTDPESVTLRADSDRPLAWLPPADATTTSEGPPRYAGRRLVASESAAERVHFADGVDGTAAARDFLAATDYEAETIYLEHRSVRACYRLELCYINWTAGSVDTDYGSYYRDADVACETDAEDVTAWLIRIPDALDPEAVTSHGSGWSSRGCDLPPAERPNRTERPPLDADPITASGSGDGNASANGTASGGEQ